MLSTKFNRAAHSSLQSVATLLTKAAFMPASPGTSLGPRLPFNSKANEILPKATRTSETPTMNNQAIPACKLT